MKLKNILILAGGDGTRFWPLSEKNTWQFFGKALVVDVINAVSKYAEKVIVVTNPANDALISEAAGKTIQTVVIKDPSQSTMGKAVFDCKNHIQGEVLILNAVDIIDFRILDRFIDLLNREKKDFIFLAKEIGEYFPGAYVIFDGEKMKGFVEKPDPDKIPSNLTKLVVDYFSDFTRLVEIIEKIKTDKDDLYEQAINLYIQSYQNVGYVSYTDYWFTIKYPWQVLGMMAHYLRAIKENHIGKNVQIAKNTIVIPPVYIADNVKIGDFTKIAGPAYIGESSVVGDHSLVRESHVGKNVLIGGGCEVARSYLGDNVMLHRDYVGDSVLGEGVLFGSGVVTANFRFDSGKIQSITSDKKTDTGMTKFGSIVGKGSKIGVNSTLLPGVKIGSNSLVMPSEVVEHDVPDNQFLHKGQQTPNRSK